MKKLLKSKLLVWIILSIMIIAQLSYIIYVFAFEKEGLHSDEIYSYGLSNSYDNSLLVSNDVHSYDYSNVNEWVSGSILKDYIVVNDGETFDYANVWKNQSTDRHPPLYYTILHTICSFFPNQFSLWFGFSINIAVFAVLQIFLYLLSRKLLKSNWLALIPCLCYGFSTGAVNTFVFIRMYALMTMWVVILAFLHSRILREKELSIKRLIPITVITMLGALTQHEFTIIAFVIAVCFCIYYLCKRKFKSFFMYGCSMALGVLLSWVIFPPLMSQIFSEGSSSEMRNRSHIIMTQLFETINILFKELFGIKLPSYLIATVFIIFIIVLVSLPLFFLFGKNKRVIKLKNSIKNINTLVIALFLSVFTILASTSCSIFFFQSKYIDRYLFCTYPFAVLLVIYGLHYSCRKIKYVKRYSGIITGVVSVALSALCLVTVEPNYLFKGVQCDELAELTTGKNCIVAEWSSLWRLVCFANILQDADNVFYTDASTLSEHINEIDSPPSDSPYVVFIPNESPGLVKSFDFYDSLTFTETVKIFSVEYDVYVQK